MRLHAVIFIAALLTQFGFGQVLIDPHDGLPYRAKRSLRQVREIKRPEQPLYPTRYAVPVEHDDIIALYNLSSYYNPVVLEVKDNRDPEIRRVITGGWIGPYQIFLLPVHQLSGDGPGGEPWQGTLWAFAAHKIRIYAGDGDHIHEAVKVPEHFGLQVDSYWRDLIEEGTK